MVNEIKPVEIKNDAAVVKVNLAQVDHHHHRPHPRRQMNGEPPHIEVDRDQMMAVKELHQLVEIDHHPETDSTTNDRIVEADPIHGLTDAEVVAEIEMQVVVDERAVVVVVVETTILSVGIKINPPQMVMLLQNQVNDGQTISMMKMIDDEMYHGDAITMMMKTMVDATIGWAMSHANGMVLDMVRTQSDNSNRILWTHDVQNVKSLEERERALFGVDHHHHQKCKYNHKNNCTLSLSLSLH